MPISQPTRVSRFKNEKAEDRFRTAYEHALGELWPGPRTALNLPTAFGTTRVYLTGPERAQPIVLLPGSGGNALMWHRYLGALSEHHRVIAVDPVGEPGASSQTAPIADGRDGAAWLEEVLTGLEQAGVELTGAQLVGCSYGGWTALCHQLHHPGRVASLTLLEPAGFSGYGAKFYTWLILGGLASTAPRPLRPRLARLVGNSTILETELMRLVRASMGFSRALPVPPVFTDEELARLTVPMRFLLGGRSAMYDSQAVADRIRLLLPAAEIEVVPGTGHDLPTDRPDLVIERLLQGVS
ncbi:alpha/beta fold hydrolase [Kitasatospora viridis]|uniref:Pimeloyl-ACP methyl ester carboxylesterase n=1 Tax=Kitasatospora viridis TaxID=281105 RepID=A0A561UQ78_9ACTN|nr:alpha/beta hydrolase [Kitasatospora viridis]TWG01533.1 pimeloyl-ACP methyl ester carboxylesterase [Kitasatospora viridis]